MASLRFTLGMIPSTSKIEQAEKALVSEYEKLKVFTDSTMLARYSELDGLVNSAEFIEKAKEIKALRYNDSEQYENEKEFKSLQKAKDIVLYFKTAPGNALKRYRELEGSEKISGYEKLEQFIKSDIFREKQKMKPITFKDTNEYRLFHEFKTLKKDREINGYYKAVRKNKRKKKDVIIEKPKAVVRCEELDKVIKSSEFQAKKRMKPITFKDSEEYKKLVEYKRQKNTLEIKEFYKFQQSKEYANFLETEGSARLSRYHELKDYVATPEFKERKQYLLDKKRFEKTQMFSEINEYKKLKKNPDIIWYFKVRDSDKFDILKSRELTFSDEFDSDRLDTGKWLTNYYWGEKLLKDRYSVESDLQSYTEKDNFEIRNSVLRINTKPQKVTGKVWSASKGFTSREFAFTSGLVNTGNSFRQKYGVFSAKIRLGNPNTRNAFWMLADKITPHVNICRTTGGKVWFDYFPADSKKFRKSVGSKYSGGYYIYTLEWTPDKLIWKINNIEVFRQTSDIPQEPMYLLLAGGLNKPVNLLTSMEIDWVRVYKQL